MRRMIFRATALATGLLAAVLVVAAAEFASYGILWAKGKMQESFGDRYTVDPNTYDLPYVGYRYRPFRKDVRPGLDTDRHGFIHNGDPDRDLTHKPDNAYRIFIVGGSTVAGNTAPQDTLSGVLERNLNRDLHGFGLQFEVINAGVSGWLSSQELALISYYLADYSPDLIISFDGFNDVYQEIRAPREGWHPNIHGSLSEMAEASYVFTRSISGTLGQAIRMTRDRSYVYQMVQETRSMIRARFDADDAPSEAPPSISSEPLRYYRRNVELMIAATKVLGARHMAVLQPTVLVSNSQGRRYRAAFIEESKSSWSGIDYWGEKEALYRRAEEIFGALAERNDDERLVAVRDYSHIFDDEAEPSYIDQAHYTAAANAVIATRLTRDLSETLLQPKGMAPGPESDWRQKGSSTSR
jgi:hypothetical protein